LEEIAMAFFSPDEYDQSSFGNPWNVASLVLLLLTAIACFMLWVGPSNGFYVAYPGPTYGYDAIP
jgi:hypothetical protein